MDCFKLKPGANRVFQITQASYLHETQKKPPYCIQDSSGSSHYYAVCPECDNPIQIVGLFRDTVEAGRKPYGRHHKGDISGLVKYKEEDYLACIYSDPNWKKPHGKRSPNSRIAHEILTLMHDQFDRIIYILSKDMEIRISPPLGEKMLLHFVNNEAWRYRMTTFNNLPWILGEAVPSTPLYGQCILRESGLCKAIEAECPAALLSEIPGTDYLKLTHKPGMYLDINFFFLDHQKNLNKETNHVEESVCYEVNSNGKRIYSKKIQIRTDYFLNLIHIPESRAHRNQKLLEIAHNMLSPVLFPER